MPEKNKCRKTAPLRRRLKNCGTSSALKTVLNRVKSLIAHFREPSGTAGTLTFKIENRCGNVEKNAIFLGVLGGS